MLWVGLLTTQARDSFQLTYLVCFRYCVLSLIDINVSTYEHSLSFKSFLLSHSDNILEKCPFPKSPLTISITFNNCTRMSMLHCCIILWKTVEKQLAFHTLILWQIQHASIHWQKTFFGLVVCNKIPSSSY